MPLTHKIALGPSPAQADYFKRAFGTARRVWNWALDERNRQYAAGRNPNAMALKRPFNAIKYTDPQWQDENGQSWLRGIHRDAHTQPFAHLTKAWNRFVADLKAGRPAHEPKFKKKGCCRDSFNAALNRKRLATATALPLVSPSGNGGAASGMLLLPPETSRLPDTNVARKARRGRKRTTRTFAHMIDSRIRCHLF